DERGHTPERVGGRIARFARAARAVTLVTAAAQGIVEAGARVAAIQRAGHVVVAVERLPAASAGLAAVVHGTGVGVVARRAVREDEDGARSRGGVAGARRVAVVRCGADDRIRPHARAALTQIELGARAPVVAGLAVGRRGIGAVASAWIADASVVALVGGRA